MKMTGNEKEKAPQEYYLWGLNQLKKINTIQYNTILSENRLDVERIANCTNLSNMRNDRRKKRIAYYLNRAHLLKRVLFITIVTFTVS